MTAIALSTFCDRARSLGGYPNSTVFTNAVLTPWVNAAIGEYAGVLDDHMAGWRDTTATVYTVASTATIALPTGATSLRRVDIYRDGEWVKLDKLGPELADSYSTTGTPAGYLHVGANVELFPTPDAIYPVRFRYPAALTPLSSDSDTFDFPDGWEDYPLQLVLIRCLKRERRDLSEAKDDADRARARIVRESGRRDTSGPPYLPNPRIRGRLRWPLP